MRQQEFNTALLFFSVVFISCLTSNSETYKIAGLDTTIQATEISISELAKSYKTYQGQYIETTGRFYQAFEEFALYTDKNIFTGEADGFWLDIDRELKIDDIQFEKMNGKRVTIKGRVDTTRKGHLGSHLATIDKIYFWKQ